MAYAYPARRKRGANRQPDPIATMSRYRYKAMMRHLADQSRVQRESARAAEDVEQSSMGKSV